MYPRGPRQGAWPPATGQHRGQERAGEAGPGAALIFVLLLVVFVLLLHIICVIATTIT